MTIAYANRGMGLEMLIEHANDQYAAKGIALIQKVATPWKVIRKGKQIVNAFPEKKSTVDFIGVYNGKPIAFDAKQTELKTRFPYANVEKHQIDFMRRWEETGGIAFMLIEFKAHKKTFLVPFAYFDAADKAGARGSIPYESFFEWRNVYEVTQGNGIVLDYLSALEVS